MIQAGGIDSRSRLSPISSAVLAQTKELHDRFLSATPFPHVTIDGFFEDDFTRELVRQFPAYEQRYAINEMGRVGGKALHPALWELGPAYQKAHVFFASRECLDWIGELTGISQLLYDEENFGGGTHENLNGQELAPHVDFNYHPKTRYHRRLNLILYLNEGWQQDWGGSITVHSNPRDPVNDQKRAYAPILNRCIIFETSEKSWHSFDRIHLPNEQQNNSRKSLSIYLYTRERAEDQSFAPHTTFYVPNPLPKKFAAGRNLTESDAAELHGILKARDELIELYQKRESARDPARLEANQNLMQLNEALPRLRLPLLGYVKLTRRTTGLYVDGWAGPRLVFDLEIIKPVRSVSIAGRFPDRMPIDAELRVYVQDKAVARCPTVSGSFQVACDVAIQPGVASMKIETSASVRPKALGMSEDVRDLGILLESIWFEHEK